jgi:hypothetical protein
MNHAELFSIGFVTAAALESLPPDSGANGGKFYLVTDIGRASGK